MQNEVVIGYNWQWHYKSSKVFSSVYLVWDQLPPNWFLFFEFKLRKCILFSGNRRRILSLQLNIKNYCAEMLRAFVKGRHQSTEFWCGNLLVNKLRSRRLGMFYRLEVWSLSIRIWVPPFIKHKINTIIYIVCYKNL